MIERGENWVIVDTALNLRRAFPAHGGNAAGSRDVLAFGSAPCSARARPPRGGLPPSGTPAGVTEGGFPGPKLAGDRPEPRRSFSCFGPAPRPQATRAGPEEPDGRVVVVFARLRRRHSDLDDNAGEGGRIAPNSDHVLESRGKGECRARWTRCEPCVVLARVMCTKEQAFLSP